MIMKKGNARLRSSSLFGSFLIPFVMLSCSGGDSSSGSSASEGFSNEPEKVSYALGVNFGENVQKGMEKQGIDSIDPEMMAQGLIDRMKENKEAMVHKDSTQQIIRSYFQKVQKRKQKANRKEGQKFLEDKRSEEGVKKTNSGLTYEVIEEGSGPKPDKWDSVKVHYEGTHIGGEVFDSSKDRGKAAKFAVRGGVVKGWTEALQMMKEGAKWDIFLPPELAYGQRGKQPDIGPSETLIFNIELQEVIEVDSAEAAKQQKRGGMRGGGLSPAQKRKLKRQMQQRRGGR
jgi:FKBP-type peptidyl-prolyl cis-trans isomerase FklB